MRSRRERLTVTIGVATFAGVCAVWALQFSPTARRMPLLAGALAMTMACVQLIADLRRPPPQSSRSPDAAASSEHAAIAWTVGLAFVVYVVGVAVALPLFVTLFWRIRDRASWPAAIGVGLGVAGFLYGVLIRMLHLELDNGLLQRWLGA